MRHNTLTPTEPIEASVGVRGMFACPAFYCGAGGSSGGFGSFGAMADAIRLRILSATGTSSIKVEMVLLAFIHVQATMIGPTFMTIMETSLGHVPLVLTETLVVQAFASAARQRVHTVTAPNTLRSMTLHFPNTSRSIPAGCDGATS